MPTTAIEHRNGTNEETPFPHTGLRPLAGPGDEVYLNTPDNPRLHGARAVIQVVEEWGVHVEVFRLATGRFRALWSELSVTPPSPIDNHTVKPVPNKVKVTKQSVRSHTGVSGEFCSKCGSADMLRAGSCLCCQNCGESQGCG